MARTLSIVIPTYNMASFLPGTAQALKESVRRSEWDVDQVVFVDDGSSDDTAAVIEALTFPFPKHVVTQANSGRLVARKVGLERASGDYVLLIDSRVELDPDALTRAYALTEEVAALTAHVEVHPSSRLIGHFWSAIEFLAWRTYWADPRPMRISMSNFERMPIGTTAFLAPRHWLDEAMSNFQSRFSDMRYANDDTAVLRQIVERHGVLINPHYRAYYRPRQSLRAFIKHAHHRGIVFLDAHATRGGRWYPVLMAGLAATVATPFIVWAWPTLSVAILLLAPSSAGALTLARGAGLRRSMAAAIYFWPFAGAYGTGIWRGALHTIRTRSAQ